MQSKSRNRLSLGHALSFETLEHRTLLAADITFGEALAYPIDRPGGEVYIADVNQDGLDDIIAKREGRTFAVLLNQGDGTFGEVVDSHLTNGPDAVTGDFDGDGYVDIAATNGFGGGLSIVLNQGVTGAGWQGFGVPMVYETPPEVELSIYLTSGDFDSDGDVDIAADVRTGIALFDNAGRSDGQWNEFAEATLHQDDTFSQAGGVTTGDVDGDSDLDLLVSQYSRGDALVLLGNGDGTFTDPVSYPIGNTGLMPLALGDLDGDGDVDIATAHFVETNIYTGTNGIAVLRGNGDGTFSAVEHFELDGTISMLTTVDLDGDGDLDIAGGYWQGLEEIFLLTNNGDGTFQDKGSVVSAVRGVSDLESGDFDGDGLADLAAAGSSSNKAVSVQINTTEILTPVDRSAGDANLDGLFSQLDLAHVLQGGKYQTGAPAVWSEGDWDGNGVFDRFDIIAALANGEYAASPPQ